MKIAKSALWLSVIDALLVLLASASGLFLKSIYARETPSWAAQGMSQDIVNLVAVVVLFIAAYFVMSSKGMPTSVGIEAFVAIIIVVSLILSVLYIREVK